MKREREKEIQEEGEQLFGLIGDLMFFIERQLLALSSACLHGQPVIIFTERKTTCEVIWEG